MTIHNNSATVAARNVQARLVSVTPMPRDPTWSNDFPYIVLRVIDKGEPTINPHSGEDYNLFSESRTDQGQILINRLDTKNLHNAIKIEADERWALDYKVTAENTMRLEFTVEMYVEGRAIIARRVASVKS